MRMCFLATIWVLIIKEFSRVPINISLSKLEISSGCSVSAPEETFKLNINSFSLSN